MAVSIYIKTHNVTGLKYFGKTEQKDPHRYKGSGKYWKSHIAAHGYDVTTEVVAVFEDESQELMDFCLNFSEENDIVESNEWANLIPENGINGGDTSEYWTEKARERMSKAAKGRTHSEESRRKMSEAQKGRTFSKETRRKISEARKRQKSKPHSEKTRERMSKAAKGRTHSEETKRKMREAKKNISEETRRKMSEAAKLRCAKKRSS